MKYNAKLAVKLL